MDDEWLDNYDEDGGESLFSKELQNVDFFIGEKEITKEEAIKNPSVRFLYCIQTFMKAGRMRSMKNDFMIGLYFHMLIGAYFKDYVIIKGGGGADPRTPVLWIQNCLKHDTEIIIKEKKGKKYVNKIKKLSELPDKFKVISHNFETNKDEVKNAVKINSGKKKLYKITLEDGKVVYATKEHKFFTNGGNEIEVKNIKVGTELAVRSPVHSEEWKEKVSNNCKKRNVNKKFIENNKIKIKERWNNEEWKNKELENRKSQHDNYLKRGEKLKIKFKGREWPVKNKDEIKNKFSNNMKINNPMFNDDIKKKHKEIMGLLHKSGKIPYFKSGINNISYGIVRYPNRVICSNGLKVKSNYEKKVVEFLLKNNLPILYETETIKIKLKSKIYTYTPDFKIKNNLYLEPKGYLLEENIEKYKKFVDMGNRLIFLAAGKSYNKLRKLNFEVYDIRTKKWEMIINEICKS